jgi:hypothetical protein
MRIKAGDFQAIKWWQQSRMGWREHIVVDGDKPADASMRVVVEFVGEVAPVTTIDHVAPRPSDSGRLVDTVRKHVQLVG